MRALLIGHFSTVGDIESLNLVSKWLTEEGILFDVCAYSRPVRQALGARAPRDLEPKNYSHVLVICGPYSRRIAKTFGFHFDLFASAVRIGVNIELLDSDNPFDVLIERGSQSSALPDLAFLLPTRRIPVVGIVLAPAQHEYGSRQRHEQARALIDEALEAFDFALIHLDTRFPASRNHSGVQSPDAYESICARLDIVVTTRLHGMVLALKAGVPVVAIDPIQGGEKVSRQAARLGWPVLIADQVSVESLRETIRSMLDAESALLAGRAALFGREELVSIRGTLMNAFDARPKRNVTGTRPYPRVLLPAVHWRSIIQRSADLLCRTNLT